MIRKHSSRGALDTDMDQGSAAKRPRVSVDCKSHATERMRLYKDNLRYNPEWCVRHPWMEYTECDGVNGMLCTVCKAYGKPPVQARGAWISRPVNNWSKAPELLDKQRKSEWHKAAAQTQVMAEVARTQGDIVEQLVTISEEEKVRNLNLLKKLIRSLYFLVKHRIPHTTVFEDLITLQAQNGDEQLNARLTTSAGNATYLSKISTAEFLECISHYIEEDMLSRLKSSQFFSIMVDESTDLASKEEMCICARWIEEGKAVEHFLGIVRVREVNAEALTCYIREFLDKRGINLQKLRGLGCDGASTMSGCKSGVQIRVRVNAPSALYVHCHCHRLQLAAVYAATEHVEVNRVLGTLLTIWKTFHFSPKKADKLSEIQAVLNAPELKIHKPSDTRWLARERCVHAVRRSLPALVDTFEAIYSESGDAEAYGLSKLLCTYKFVACIYMLCDVLHVVAKLQGSLQTKDLDLATIPAMVDGTITRLKELKEKPVSSTWFKDHSMVLSEPSQLGKRKIIVTESDKEAFIARIYCPYIQSVLDNVASRLQSSDILSAFSVFDIRHVPNEEAELPNYGTDKIQVLANFYGNPQQVTFKGKTGVSICDVDKEQVEAEWKLLRRVLFSQFKESHRDGEHSVISSLLTNSTILAAFPNIACLASIALVLPVTTATVERSFSDMKLVKTRLRSRLGEGTLDQALRVCIEGPEYLSDSALDAIITDWKERKQRRIAV